MLTSDSNSPLDNTVKYKSMTSNHSKFSGSSHPGAMSREQGHLGRAENSSSH